MSPLNATGSGDSRPPLGVSPRLALHLIIFIVFLSLWTWKLLEPHPVPDEISSGLARVGLSLIAAKSLHLAGYAFLTVLGVTLAPRRKWWVVGFLVLHGVGTEIGQAFAPNRTGRVRDVLIDCGGVLLGVLVLRAWWRSSGHRRVFNVARRSAS